jgi:hypothetical protein
MTGDLHDVMGERGRGGLRTPPRSGRKRAADASPIGLLATLCEERNASQALLSLTPPRSPSGSPKTRQRTGNTQSHTQSHSQSHSQSRSNNFSANSSFPGVASAASTANAAKILINLEGSQDDDSDSELEGEGREGGREGKGERGREGEGEGEESEIEDLTQGTFDVPTAECGAVSPFYEFQTEESSLGFSRLSRLSEVSGYGYGGVPMVVESDGTDGPGTAAGVGGGAGGVTGGVDSRRSGSGRGINYNTNNSTINNNYSSSNNTNTSSSSNNNNSDNNNSNNSNNSNNNSGSVFASVRLTAGASTTRSSRNSNNNNNNSTSGNIDNIYNYNDIVNQNITANTANSSSSSRNNYSGNTGSDAHPTGNDMRVTDTAHSRRVGEDGVRGGGPTPSDPSPRSVPASVPLHTQLSSGTASNKIS